MDKQSEDDAYRVQPPQRRGVLQRLRVDDMSQDCGAQLDGSNGRLVESRMHCTRHHVAIGQLSRTRYEIVAVASAVTLYR